MTMARRVQHPQGLLLVLVQLMPDSIWHSVLRARLWALAQALAWACRCFSSQCGMSVVCIRI